MVTLRHLPPHGDLRDVIEGGAKLSQIKSSARPWPAWQDAEEPPAEKPGRTDWERYGMCSIAVTRSGLSVYAKLLYVHLDSVQGKNGRPAEGWRNVAEQIDISETACRRGMAELEEAGLVRVEDAGKARATFHLLHHLQRDRVNPRGVALPPKRLKGKKTNPPPRLRQEEAPPSEGDSPETKHPPERVIGTTKHPPERGKPLGNEVGEKGTHYVFDWETGDFVNLETGEIYVIPDIDDLLGDEVTPCPFDGDPGPCPFDGEPMPCPFDGEPMPCPF